MLRALFLNKTCIMILLKIFTLIIYDNLQQIVLDRLPVLEPFETNKCVL